jgi:hypothetical protein
MIATGCAKTNNITGISNNERDSIELKLKNITAPPVDAYSDYLCTDNEKVFFSFKMENSPKTMSICLSNKQPDYLVYRFGTKDKIELQFPENNADSWNKFVYSYYLRGGEQETMGWI